MLESDKTVDHSMRITVDTMPNIRVDLFRVGRDHFQDDVSPVNWKIADKGDWCMRICGTHRDRDMPGKIVTVLTTSYYYGWNKHGPTKKQLAKAVRESIVHHLKHEVDEGLWIDGERVFDPHK